MWNEFRQTGRNYSEPVEVERYDQTHADFRDVEAEAREALSMLGLPGGATVLDIGCGTGIFVAAAAETCGEVVGVDVSEAMLAKARRRAAALGRNNVRFEHCGFLTCEHQGTPLDAVTTSFALHHLPDYWQAVALRRIHAMLGPGGRFYLRDVVIPDGPDIFQPVQSFIDEQTEAGGNFLREDAEGHFREEFSTFDWVITGMLQRAGFTILDHRVEAHVISTYLCAK